MIEIHDRNGRKRDYPYGGVSWSMDIYGNKSWTGLAYGDRIIVNGCTVFIAEIPIIEQMK